MSLPESQTFGFETALLSDLQEPVSLTFTMATSGNTLQSSKQEKAKQPNKVWRLLETIMYGCAFAFKSAITNGYNWLTYGLF